MPVRLSTMLRRIFLLAIVLASLFILTHQQTTNSNSNVTAALQDLCTQMPGMPGCSLRSTCQSASATIPSPYCTPQSLLTDICVVDGMSGMTSCSGYSSICPSQTGNCAQLPGIPTSKTLATQIQSICTQMTMDGCEKCPKLQNPATKPVYDDCDMLSVYSMLCQAMPNMAQCSTYAAYCADSSPLSASPYCPASPQTSAPVMKMYFHTGLLDYVLFESWVPRTTAQFVGYWFFGFLLGVLFEFLQGYHQILEAQWTEQMRIARKVSAKASASRANNAEATSTAHSAADTAYTPMAPGTSGGLKTIWGLFKTPSPLSNRRRVHVSFIRAVYRFVTATIAYILMLITMTYNVALFFSVVAGLAVGTFLVAQKVKEIVLIAINSSDRPEEPETTTAAADLCC
ncbi:Ctr copper transporter family-domain-containing protein [Polychytrium aggregatum]|uniref:Ctr copper transporter family-domain-containing protein n=1 Tax=Polychytrium aggregatum TaxID=110093 RepID=UPI0022FF0F3A|nr:Ctr copper transporter family-domain-containing protein [Polychytrium aggregatum]KAI9204065.1 Ctr copper transporter family-domain-containing protein [Polychytrium aggregatum]